VRIDAQVKEVDEERNLNFRIVNDCREILVLL